MDPLSLNVLGPKQLIESKLNKISGGVNSDVEGVEGEREDEFTLKLSDEELLLLSVKWEAKYAGYEGQIKPRQEKNKAYYLGKQTDGSNISTSGIPIAANLIFEAAETFYPAALAKNPEPVVYADNTTEGTAISGDIKTMLQHHADILVLRRKLTLMTRHWSIYFLGVMKHGWDNDIKDIKSEVIDPRKLVLDPDATIDVYGDYDGEYIGERKTCTASKLIELFPKHKDYITIMVDGMLGTNVIYTEWWSDKYAFYTFKKVVLDKHKNPHFNEPQKIEGIDSSGQPVSSMQPGRNHFVKAKKPYTFLSVFSLGEQPHDVTGLIEQNIPNQNRITAREVQIDINLNRSNNSIALSEDNFNQETGKQASMALQKGNPVLVPPGKPIQEAIMRLPAPAIPDAFFKASDRDKQDLRSIFGTEGITSQPGNEDTTARGMILNQQFDNTRIGGGIGDALEQVADNIFNWWVQLYYVHYDEPHIASILGQMKAVEYIQLSSQDINRKVIVSVTPDSMKPHDELTEMNQAMSLYEAGVLDPKTLLTMLNVPDPQKTAESTVLWLLDKNAYLQLNFPELAQQLQQVQQQQMMQGGGPPPGQAPGGSPPPGQTPSQPPPTLGMSPASSNLNNVPLPQ